jgi:hypothetical protein
MLAGARPRRRTVGESRFGRLKAFVFASQRTQLIQPFRSCARMESSGSAKPQVLRWSRAASVSIQPRPLHAPGPSPDRCRPCRRRPSRERGKPRHCSHCLAATATRDPRREDRCDQLRSLFRSSVGAFTVAAHATSGRVASSSSEMPGLQGPRSAVTVRVGTRVSSSVPRETSRSYLPMKPLPPKFGVHSYQGRHPSAVRAT